MAENDNTLPEAPTRKRETIEALVFEAGEAVPDWLITGEPRKGAEAIAHLGACVFAQRCAIIEMPKAYICVPLSEDFAAGPCMSFDAANVHFFTLERDLLLMTVTMAIGTGAEQ